MNTLVHQREALRTNRHDQYFYGHFLSSFCQKTQSTPAGMSHRIACTTEVEISHYVAVYCDPSHQRV